MLSRWQQTWTLLLRRLELPVSKKIILCENLWILLHSVCVLITNLMRIYKQSWKQLCSGESLAEWVVTTLNKFLTLLERELDVCETETHSIMTNFSSGTEWLKGYPLLDSIPSLNMSHTKQNVQWQLQKSCFFLPPHKKAPPFTPSLIMLAPPSTNFHQHLDS